MTVSNRPLQAGARAYHPLATDWKSLIYVELESIAVMWLASVMNDRDPDMRTRKTVFQSLMYDLTLASVNNSFIYSKDRTSVLVPCSRRAKNGKQVFLLCERNLLGYQRYCVTRKRGGFLLESDVDWTFYEAAVCSQTVCASSVVDLANVGKLDIGYYHILNERNRVARYVKKGAYSQQCDALDICVCNALELARANPSFVQLYSYKGCFEVVIPFVDAEKRVHTGLAVVLKYNWATRIAEVPTILDSRMVVADCNRLGMPLATWLKGRYWAS